MDGREMATLMLRAFSHCRASNGAGASNKLGVSWNDAAAVWPSKARGTSQR